MKKTTDLPCATRAKRCWKHGLLTLAVSMMAFPSLAVDGIRPETRERVKQALAQYPKFNSHLMKSSPSMEKLKIPSAMS